MSILDSKSIPYDLVDIAQNSDDKDLMRKIARNPTALPPQICNGDVYCGVSLTQQPAKVIIRHTDDVTPQISWSYDGMLIIYTLAAFFPGGKKAHLVVEGRRRRN